jgi:methionine--tRNA ligase beta chain
MGIPCKNIICCILKLGLDESKKLLKLLVDIGGEKRQIVSGIAPFHTPEQLIGKRVVVLTNLQPAQLMGVEAKDGPRCRGRRLL